MVEVEVEASHDVFPAPKSGPRRGLSLDHGLRRNPLASFISPLLKARSGTVEKSPCLRELTKHASKPGFANSPNSAQRPPRSPGQDQLSSPLESLTRRAAPQQDEGEEEAAGSRAPQERETPAAGSPQPHLHLKPESLLAWRGNPPKEPGASAGIGRGEGGPRTSLGSNEASRKGGGEREMSEKGHFGQAQRRCFVPCLPGALEDRRKQ